MTKASKKSNLPINIGLFMASMVLAFLVLEFASRTFFNISSGAKYFSPEGKRMVISESSERFLPNIESRMVSEEFDVKLSFSPLGHRVPEVRGNPDIVFVGDSFTFGTGLNDDETFVYRFCEKASISCANLGRPGTGTVRQLNILEHFLEEENWRPKEVKLFMLLMTSAFMAGNDFADVLKYEKKLKQNQSTQSISPSSDEKLSEKILGFRKWFLAQSNLVRVVYYFFAPAIREKFSPTPVEEKQQAAYEIMRKQIRRLDEIAGRYQFTYKIYVLHPMQDIIGGSYLDTLKTIQEIANQAVPGLKVIETASGLLDDPLSYYYNFDGHFNLKGSAKIVEVLWNEWRAEGENIKPL
jgi:hypothetical protein